MRTQIREPPEASQLHNMQSKEAGMNWKWTVLLPTNTRQPTDYRLSQALSLADFPKGAWMSEFWHQAGSCSVTQNTKRRRRRMQPSLLPTKMITRNRQKTPFACCDKSMNSTKPQDSHTALCFLLAEQFCCWNSEFSTWQTNCVTLTLGGGGEENPFA